MAKEEDRLEQRDSTDGGRRILLAEDNKVNQLVARSLLEKRGHRVRVADNGLEAVDAVREEEFDIVLMDIQMPGLDGVSATDQIRQLPSGTVVPILALTAHDTEDERRRCSEVGMNGFLSKPFQPMELLEAVDRFCTSDPPETRADTEGEVPVRIERFRELMREAGIEEIVEETLHVYRLESPGRLDRLQEALRQADPKSIEAEAHALKSASLNIWAVELAEYLDQAENSAVAGDIARAQALMDPIRNEFARVLEYLHLVLPEVS